MSTSSPVREVTYRASGNDKCESAHGLCGGVDGCGGEVGSGGGEVGAGGPGGDGGGTGGRSGDVGGAGGGEGACVMSVVRGANAVMLNEQCAVHDAGKTLLRQFVCFLPAIASFKAMKAAVGSIRKSNSVK